MDTKPGFGTWAVAVVSAAAGAVAAKAAAPAVVTLLTSVGIGLAPIALAVGAVGGGSLGWNFMRKRE